MSSFRQYTGPYGQHFSDNPYHRDPSIEEFARDLARASNYKLSEVEANRNGFMSTPQFFRLLWQASLPLRTATVSLFAWLGLFALLGSIFRVPLMRMVFFQNYALEMVGVTLSLLLSFVIAFLTTSNKTWNLLSDLQNGEVTSVEGRLDPSWGEEIGEGIKQVKREMVPYYRFSVRQEAFDVTPQAFDLLQSKYSEFRPVVRLYFTPRSRMLLSMEPVVADPSNYQGSC